jgi:DNA-binding transcriptional LysR family regulator
MSEFHKTKLRQIDFTLLLVFSEAMQHRKLAIVATRLGLSQPAISHALKRLRLVFDDELFLRRPHGIEPTARALALEPEVMRLLEAAQQAFVGPSSFDPATAKRDIRVAAPDFEVALLAPKLVNLVATHAPGLRLAFRHIVRAAALRALSEGEVDLVLGYLQPGPDFVAQPLFDETFRVVCRKRHPRIGTRLSLQTYVACDHVLVSLGGDFDGVADRALREMGLSRRVVASIPHFVPALATVAETDVIATVPARLAELYAVRLGLKTFRPPLKLPSFNVRIFRHRRDRNDATLDWICARLKEAVA